MFKSFIGNQKSSVLCFLLVLLSFSFLQAQDKKANPEVEKVYLHTDRSRYFIGEDLWYKAYNVHANNNILFDNSNILYVELISPESKIVASNKTNLEIGLGNGDFHLADSLGIKPGLYQLRAYTNWNRNFGEDFIFKKNIEIIDVFEAHSTLKKMPTNVTQPKSVAIKTENNFQIDFFPEGGSLLESVSSIVGFKAVDTSGNPINVSGEVYDSDNELVTSFSSPHDGMGKFQILPIEGKNYYAKIKNAGGTELKVNLPKAVKQGYLLNFRVFKGRNILTINTNPATLSQNPNAAVTVVCKAKGMAYLESTQTLTELTLSFELAKEKAPQGISQITLYDNNNRPQSERLVYIEKDQDLEVQLTTDKPSYQPNEKATVNVSSKSKAGVAKSASFSLSVTDMNGITDEKDLGTNISSFFLMEADIRGNVHNPGYYFDAGNLKRLDHLDDLLLTQGWRDFLWKTAPKFNGTMSYVAEKGITVTGRVKQLLGEKALVNNNMTLALMNKKGMNIFNAVTDSLGSFKFENIMFSGKTNMFLNSRNEKGKFRGEIIVNPIEQPPLLITFKNEPINWTDSTRLIVENVFKKYAAFGVQPENVLDEVNIVAKKKKSLKSYFGIPEFTYITDDDKTTFIDIYEMIIQKVPGVMPFEDSVSFTRNSAPPLFVLNGNIAFKEEIASIRPEDVEKIEVVKGLQATTFFGEEAANGFIALYTKPNTGNRVKEKFHSIKREVMGFYTAKAFYTPSLDKPDFELENKEAVRNTLYWNPYVHPDKTGNVSVNYNNTKVETKVKVTLEGITATGIPVVKNTYYTIKK